MGLEKIEKSPQGRPNARRFSRISADRILLSSCYQLSLTRDKMHALYHVAEKERVEIGRFSNSAFRSFHSLQAARHSLSNYKTRCSTDEKSARALLLHARSTRFDLSILILVRIFPFPHAPRNLATVISFIYRCGAVNIREKDSDDMRVERPCRKSEIQARFFRVPWIFSPPPSFQCAAPI